jgi:hypothetical protein
LTPCYICGSPMEHPKLDPRDGKTRPCSHCEAVIHEIVDEYDDDSGEYAYLDSDLDDFEEEIGDGEEEISD